MKIFTPAGARHFVASTLYCTGGLTKRERLYAKARELVSGDRAEIMCETGDVEYRKSAKEFTHDPS